MDHDPDKHDDQAIALALAANHLITRPPKRQWAAHKLPVLTNSRRT